MPEGDPLAALDARITVLRTIRSSAPRFSDAYWEADDTLAWLRVLRDEVSRTGQIRDEVMAFLETPPRAFLIASAPVDSVQLLEDPAVIVPPTENDDELPEPVPTRRSSRYQPTAAPEPVGAS